MAEDKQGRRVKVTDASATHRVGTKRAAVKPHKRVSAPDPKQIIAEYLNGLRAGSLKQTYTGDTLVKNAALLRKSFALDANDELYLLMDPTGTGKAGLLLSASGLHVADGRGGTGDVAWSDLSRLQISCQNNAVIIGQTGIQSRDAQAIATLLQQIQTKLAK